MVSPLSPMFVGKQKLSISKGKGREGQQNLVIPHGNSVMETLSGFLSKLGNSWLQFHFFLGGGGEGRKYAFPSLLYIGYVSECMFFCG